MIRTICMPNEDKVLLTLPKDYVGREIEILVFPFIEEFREHSAPLKTFTDFGLDAVDYKFDREEANAR